MVDDGGVASSASTTTTTATTTALAATLPPFREDGAGPGGSEEEGDGSSSNVTIAIAVAVAVTIVLVALLGLLVRSQTTHADRAHDQTPQRVSTDAVLAGVYRRLQQEGALGDAESNAGGGSAGGAAANTNRLGGGAAAAAPRTIARDAIKLVNKIGKGAFGEVHKANLDEGVVGGVELPAYIVAVKSCLANNTQAVSEFWKEAVLMAQVPKHENVVGIIGVVTEGPMKLLVMVGRRCSPLCLTDWRLFCWLCWLCRARAPLGASAAKQARAVLP